MSIESLIGRTTTDHLGIEFSVVAVVGDRIVLRSEIGERSCMGLDLIVRHEDISEDNFHLQPDDRLTCHGCKAWATDEHFESEQHRSL